MKSILILPALALISACTGTERFDPPPEGAELLPVLGSDLRYYALERRREADGKVRALVFTQFPQPARNAAGYAGYEVECENLYRTRSTGRGTVDEAKAGKEAETQARYLNEGSVLKEIAIRLCD